MVEKTEQREEELVEAALNGDTEAFGLLVKMHQRGIYKLIRRFSNNHEDANDLTQETFMKAYHSLASFRRESRFFTWLYRIAVRQVFTHYKKNRKAVSDDGQTVDIPVHLTPETIVSGREGTERLNRAIQQLPEKIRMAVELVYIQDLSHLEAAEILACPEKTVSWRIFEAKKMLKKKLNRFKGAL